MNDDTSVYSLKLIHKLLQMHVQPQITSLMPRLQHVSKCGGSHVTKHASMPQSINVGGVVYFGVQF